MKKNFKIGIFTSSFLPAEGGAEIGLHNLANSFIKQNLDVTVITSYRHYLSLKKKHIELPYKVISFPPKVFHLLSKFNTIGYLYLSLFFEYLRRKKNFDIWHISFAYPLGVNAIKYCIKKKIPHVMMCHGEDIQINKCINYGIRRDNKINKIIKFWLPKADMLIANSESIIAEYNKIKVKKIELIPFGIDLKRVNNYSVKKKIREHFSIPDKGIVFLCLGRYHPKKNFETVIDSFKKINLSRKGIHLIIAGNGVNILKNKILKINRIHLYEPNNVEKLNYPSSEIYDLYSACDIFIMPSIIETQGLVTIEAASFGLPIIISKVPGNKDIFKENQCLYYDGSSKQLIERIFFILENKKKIISLKRYSKFVAKKYDSRLMSKKYLNLFYKLKLLKNIK